jgi:EmrB/QacA subfamily drug resistance transporter
MLAAFEGLAGEAVSMSSAIVATPEAPASTRPPWWTPVCVCGATFMLLVDVTIIQVALPSIQRDFHASFGDLEWMISAYALSLSALILTSGALADRFGRKRLFCTGLAVFTLFSLVCGLAGNSLVLIVARALQGLGGAAMFATSLALIGQDFKGRQRGTAIAAWSATVGGAVSVGPLLGGVLTDGLGWRWIFFVNVPIGVLTLAGSLARMRNVRDPGARGIDVAGLVTFSGGLFLLVLGLIRGNGDGWGSGRIVGLLSGAAATLLLFVIVERRQPRPMFDLSLFRKAAFTGVSLGTFAIGAGMFALLLYLTLYLQDVLGYSPLQGGLRLLPITAFAFLMPMLTARLTERLSPGTVLGSALALVALGLGMMHTISSGSDWTGLLPGMMVSGIGIGLANPAIAKVALGVVAVQRSGMASGISNTFRIGGLATGVAVLGAVFEHGIASSLAGSGRVSSQLAPVLASGGTRAVAALGRPGVVPAARVAFLSGLQEILLLGAVIVVVGAVVALSMIRRRDLQPPAEVPAGVLPTTPSMAPTGPTPA